MGKSNRGRILPYSLSPSRGQESSFGEQESSFRQSTPEVLRSCAQLQGDYIKRDDSSRSRADISPVAMDFEMLRMLQLGDAPADRISLVRCFFNEDISKAVKFSVASSQEGGIDINICSDTLHVPKHCSVHHPVVQMVLTIVTRGSFYSPRSIVPKAVLDIIEKSSSDAWSTNLFTFSEAGRVLPRSRSTNSHDGGALSAIKPEKVDRQTDRSNRLSFPLLFDVSVETLISKTLGPVNSVWAQETKDQHYILMNLGNEQNDLPCELDQPIHSSKHPVHSSKHPDANEILIGDTKPAHLRVCEGTPLNSSGSGGKRHDSKMHVLVSPQSLTPSKGSSSATGTPAPLLWLDSGAFHHVVGDAGILTDLRDPPAGTVVTVADGFQLSVTKLGVIQAPHIKISDVYLVPGLKLNLVSVRQLAKRKIATTFYENHAELWLDGEKIGGAIVDDDVDLY